MPVNPTSRQEEGYWYTDNSEAELVGVALEVGRPKPFPHSRLVKAVVNLLEFQTKFLDEHALLSVSPPPHQLRARTSELVARNIVGG